MQEIVCRVVGKVQGVMYRTYVQDAATKLELTSYVENCADGTVAVVAQGIPDTLKELVEYLHEGSSLSRVEEVSVEWQTPKQLFEEFSIKYV